MINTRNRRASILGTFGPYYFAGPTADGTIDNRTDRRHMARLYAGLLTAEPPVATLPTVDLDDVSSHYTTGQSNVLTFSATIGSGQRLLVFVWHYDHFLTVTSVTFNGTPLTFKDTIQQNYIYYLAAPTVGTHNVVVTLSGARWMGAIAIPVSGWDGVLRDIPGSISQNYKMALSGVYGSVNTLTFGSNPNDLTIHVIRSWFATTTSGLTYTPGAEQTLLENQSPGPADAMIGAASSKPGALSTTAYFGVSPDWYSFLAGFSLRAPDEPPDVGTVPPGINPPASVIPTIYPQVFITISDRDGGDIVAAYAEQRGGPFSDRSVWFGGWKEARIISISTIRRSTSTTTGGIQLSSWRIVLDDTDLELRNNWNVQHLKNYKLDVYVIDHNDRIQENEPYRIAAGLIPEHGGGDQLTYEIATEGMLGRYSARKIQEKKVPTKPLILPILLEKFASGWYPPVGYGELSDESYSVPQGVVKGQFVGYGNLQDIIGPDATNVEVDAYVFFGHAVEDTLNLYYNPPHWQKDTSWLVGEIIRPTQANGHRYRCITPGPGGSTEPTFPTGVGATVSDGSAEWEEYGDYDGTQRMRVPEDAYGSILVVPHKPNWTAITSLPGQYVDYIDGRFTVAFVDRNYKLAEQLRNESILLTGNFRAIEDVGDATGGLIEAPARIVQHFWTNFIENSYQQGAWFPVPTFGDYSSIDTDTVEACVTYEATMVPGGLKGAILIGASGGQENTFDVLKKLCRSFDLDLAENRHGQIVMDHENPTGAAAVTLNQQDDLVKFRTSARAADYYNLILGKYGPRYVTTADAKVAPAAGGSLPAVEAINRWFSGLVEVRHDAAITKNKGEEVPYDLELDGIRDPDSADAIFQRVLTRLVGEGPEYEGPVTATATTGWKGSGFVTDYLDVFSRIGLTTIEGVGSGGYTAKRMRSKSIAFDCLEGLVTHEGFVQPEAS